MLHINNNKVTVNQVFLQKPKKIQHKKIQILIITPFKTIQDVMSLQDQLQQLSPRNTMQCCSSSKSFYICLTNQLKPIFHTEKIHSSLNHTHN